MQILMFWLSIVQLLLPLNHANWQKALEMRGIFTFVAQLSGSWYQRKEDASNDIKRTEEKVMCASRHCKIPWRKPSG